jgi:hypothetical protein
MNELTYWYPILLSVLLAVLGYLKNRGKEDFSGWKFCYTIFWGIVIAIVSIYFKLQVSEAETLVLQLATQVGLVEFTSLFFKALWVNGLRDFVKKIFPFLWQENLST